MIKYPSIKTVFKRDPETKFKTLLMGEYSMPEFEYLKDNLWDFTEKVDGMNIRVIFNCTDFLDGSVSFRGRTDKAQLPMDLVERLQELFPIEKFTKLWPLDDTEENSSICLYGEGFGAGIQKGGKYSDHKDFVLFDIKMGEVWLKREDVVDIAQKMKIMSVPYLGTEDLNQLVELVEKPIASNWGDFEMEGIVARPIVELFDRFGNRIITKLKAKDFKGDIKGE